MKAAEQVNKFKEFIEQNYVSELLANLSEGKPYLNINFLNLSAYDPELAHLLLEQPEDAIKAGELALDQFDLDKDEKIHIRFFNLPLKEKVSIRNIRSKHLNKLVIIEGIVRQKSDVRPQIEKAKFECPSCAAIQTISQTEKTLKEPKKCTNCGYKGKFSLVSKDLVDVQGMILEESSDTLDGGEQPKRLNILLKEDLVSPISEKKTNPGSNVRVVGILKELVIEARQGGKTLTKYDLILHANYIEPLEEDYSNIIITKEEKRKIKEISEDPRYYEKLIKSLAPGIYGHEKVKEAILLLFLGGVLKERSDGVKNRGDTHILLIGDPGSGKSQLLKRASVIAPKGKYVSGKGASGAGLCVSPKSRICTNPGGIECIKTKIEPKIDEDKKYNDWVWHQDENIDFKIQSMSHDLKIHSKKPSKLWKLKSPEYVYEIELCSGKKIELTGNTQLFSIEKGVTVWKKSSDISVNEYIATPKRLVGGNCTNKKIIDLIESNPVIHHVKNTVKECSQILKTKYKTRKQAAKKLGFSENNLYYNWVNEHARGNIKLKDFRNICEKCSKDPSVYIKEISLYNGKKHTIPRYVSKQLLYITGLIAGDGDVRKSGETYSIRFSNNNETLHDIFKRTLVQEFGLSFDIQKGNESRSKTIRTHSKILKEILDKLGIPLSPKSHRIEMSDILLHMKNEFLSEYIAGLFDSDGSINLRNKNSKGSYALELTSCSENLIRQLQIVLLRYKIYSKIRSREPSKGKIKGTFKKWILEIRGYENIQKFEQHILIKHPEKKRKLEEILKTKRTSNTYRDIIPGLNEYCRKNNIPLKNYHSQISYKRAKEIAKKYRDPYLYKIAHSDIHWEKIKNITKKKPEYEYVYDVTVEESHNFVVDGILVHNTAAVVRDEFLGGWALEAGTLVLANKGFAMIDELDKMSSDDTSAMHEALEQQSVTISKANIQATLRCETTVLAAANPKFGRFDPYEPLAKQINLPPALINRFDLIFPFRDIPDEQKDDMMANFVLDMHQSGEVQKVDLETDLLRKYITFARQNIKPILTDGALAQIKEFYVRMRNSNNDKDNRAIPISARQLEALVRLTEASAKTRLSSKATKHDAERAIELLEFCLNQVGVDTETGQFDIDQITTGVTTRQRNKTIIIREIIKEIEDKIGKIFPIEELIKEAEIKGIPEDEVREAIEKLKRSGDIFEPKPGFISRI